MDESTSTGTSTRAPASDRSCTVSVVMAVRDASAHVRAALLGLEQQVGPRMQVVVVDDGSRDDTAAVVSTFPSRHAIELVSLTSHSGVAQARNTGLARATGEYVWFTDVDDEWDPELVAKLLAAAERDGSDVALCRARQVWGDGSGERVLPSGAPAGRHVGDRAVAALLTDTGALWNKLFRRSVLGGSPFPRLSSKSDRAGIAAILGRVDTVSVLDEVLYTYVRQQNSISNGGVVEPGNFIAALETASETLRSSAPSTVLRVAVRTYRYDTYARVLREVWRFYDRVTDPDVLVARVRREIRVSDVVRVAPRDPTAAATCLAALISPRLSRIAITRIGTRIWVPRRPGNHAPRRPHAAGTGSVA